MVANVDNRNVRVVVFIDLSGAYQVRIRSRASRQDGLSTVRANMAPAPFTNEFRAVTFLCGVNIHAHTFFTHIPFSRAHLFHAHTCDLWQNT
jgi:hypothetical protein